MTSPGAYGISPYGLGPFGGVTQISILEAFPLGARSVYIRFNVPPLTASPVSVGDCQNRQTWNLTRSDTGARIEVVGAVQLGLPTERKLILLSSLGPSAVLHNLDCTALRSAGGQPSVPPYVIKFYGVDVDKPAFGLPSRKPAIVDLRNVFNQGQGQALQVGSGGGYAVQEGPSGLRKRLIRMLTTTPGSDPFDPLFGTELGIKEIVVNPAGQRALILAQILRDPEVGAAKVSLDVSDGGVATILIVAAMKAGGQQSATFVVDEGGVRLA